MKINSKSWNVYKEIILNNIFLQQIITIIMFSLETNATYVRSTCLTTFCKLWYRYHDHSYCRICSIFFCFHNVVSCCEFYERISIWNKTTITLLLHIPGQNMSFLHYIKIIANICWKKFYVPFLFFLLNRRIHIDMK